MNFATAVVVWACVTALGLAVGILLGYRGRAFVLAMTIASALLAGHVFSAVKSVQERVLAWLTQRGGWIAVLWPLGAIVVYAAFVIGWDWKIMLAGAAYVLVPAILVATAGPRVLGRLQEFAAIAVIFLPVALRSLRTLWPYPPELTHTMMILFAVNTALAVFLYMRRLAGIGYVVEWGPGFTSAVFINFAVFATLAIAIGEATGFIHFAPSVRKLGSMPFAAVGILLTTAWPEEFLFRGLIQNLLMRTMKSPWVALIVASLIFGFAHINNGAFPNWRYFVLASFAGIAYGLTWMKTGSIFASAVVHAMVDTLWHVLFR